MVAAGSGRRFGGAKQYERLGGRRVLDWALAACRAIEPGVASEGARSGAGSSRGVGVVLVVPPDRAGRAEPAADAIVAGGGTRSASVRAGLGAVPPDASLVLVHDAARPVPVPGVWERVLAALDQGADAVVPVVPLTDTLRERGGPTVDRGRFVAVQTPQGFRAEVLRRAHRAAPEGSDDASLVEAIGATVVTVDGDPANIKVTTALDLRLADLLCRSTRNVPSVPNVANVPNVPSVRR